MPRFESPQNCREPDSFEEGVYESPGLVLTDEQRDLVKTNLDFAGGGLYRRLGLITIDPDLQQAAYVGLIEAASRFKSSGEADFTSFAFWRIRGAVIDELRRRNPLKEKDFRKVKEWKNAEDRLAQQLQRWPTRYEVAKELDLDDKQSEEIAHLISMGQQITIEEPPPRGDRHDETDEAVRISELLANNEIGPEEATIEAIDKPRLVEAIWDKIESLVYTQKDVLVRHYMGNVAISEIAKEQRVSFQAVNQRKNIALNHLAKALVEAA